MMRLGARLLSQPSWILAGLYLLIWVGAGKSYPVICNDSSRLAAIESLAVRGTFDISGSPWIDTCDKVKVVSPDGRSHYYSDKTPVLSLLGAGVYKGLRGVGVDLRENMSVAYRLLTFFLVIVPGLAIFHFLHLGLRDRSSRVQSWIIAGAVFGTLILPYSQVLNSFVPAAACLLGAYVLVSSSRLKQAGLLLGLAVAFELSAGFFWISLVALGLWRGRGRELKERMAFLAYAVAPVLITLWIYRSLSGEWIPINLRIEGYQYPGSLQRPEYLLGGSSFRDLTPESVLTYLWHGWFGYKGIFSHSAVLLLGFLGLKKMLGEPSERLNALSVLLPIAASAAVFALDATHYFGGSSYGYRYMIPWMPLVALFMARIPGLSGGLAGPSLWTKAVVVLSIVTSASGIRSPWLFHSWRGLDLKTFDFVWVHDPASSPYRVVERNLASALPRIRQLERQLERRGDPDSLAELAFIYYQAMQPSRALGYLQMMGETAPDSGWQCFSSVIFSDRGLRMPDMMQRYRARCPEEKWAEIAPKLGAE